MQHIMYGLDKETGMVISRMGSEVAVPVLQYDKMQPKNNFRTEYELEKMDVIAIAREYRCYTWTRKIPFDIKNQHRKFWSMKPLKRRPNSHELTAIWGGVKFEHAGYTFVVVKVEPHKTNPDFDIVVLENKTKKQKTSWSFGGMKVYLKENPKAIVR